MTKEELLLASAEVAEKVSSGDLISPTMGIVIALLVVWALLPR